MIQPQPEGTREKEAMTTVRKLMSIPEDISTVDCVEHPVRSQSGLINDFVPTATV